MVMIKSVKKITLKEAEIKNEISIKNLKFQKVSALPILPILLMDGNSMPIPMTSLLD